MRHNVSAKEVWWASSEIHQAWAPQLSYDKTTQLCTIFRRCVASYVHTYTYSSCPPPPPLPDISRHSSCSEICVNARTRKTHRVPTVSNGTLVRSVALIHQTRARTVARKVSAANFPRSGVGAGRRNGATFCGLPNKQSARTPPVMDVKCGTSTRCFVRTRKLCQYLVLPGGLPTACGFAKLFGWLVPQTYRTSNGRGLFDKVSQVLRSDVIEQLQREMAMHFINRTTATRPPPPNQNCCSTS